jgi:RNA polymerase sigma-70 factor, ECF subfamily
MEERPFTRRAAMGFSERDDSSETPAANVSITDAFADLYRQHAPAVYRFAMRCVSRKDLAEDLTSEAFLALFRNLDRIDASRLPAWLLTVVRNRARDHWRRQTVEQSHAASIDAANTVEQPPLERWLLESPDLKPVHRTCLMLRYVYGMTRAEIAGKTGFSEMQVKGYLQYGLEVLRRNYSPEVTR